MAIDSATTLLVNALATLSSETGIDSIGDDGIARALLEIPLTQVANLWQQTIANNSQLVLTSASGSSLDALGALLGIPRNTSTSGVTSPNGMKFYIPNALSSDVVISAGTMVWNPTTPSAYFMTTGSATILNGYTEAFCAIGTPFVGSSTAAPNTLTSSNAPSGVLCTNLESIAGSASEEDAQYQYRLLNGRAGRNGTSPDSLRTKILGYSGVLDVQMLPFRRGPGTLDIIVFTNSPIPSATTLQSILSYARSWVAAGTSVQVYGPTPVTIDISMALAFANNTSSSSMVSLRKSSIGAIQNYINTYTLGETFYPTRLIDIVMNIDPSIIDAIVTSLYVSGSEMVVGPVLVNAYQQVVAGNIVVS